MNVFDEVAAAEAELRAAQEKLDAVKARAAAAQQPAAQPRAAQPTSAPQQSAAQPTGAQRPFEYSEEYRPPSYQAARPAEPQQPFCGQPVYQQPQDWSAYQQPHPYATQTSKDHVAAGLLGIFLGSLGIHKFYLGYNKPGFIMLAVTVLGSILTFGLAGAIMCLIAFIEGVIYLTKSQSDFERIYVFGQKEWF